MILVDRVKPDLIVDEISGLRNVFDSHKTWTVSLRKTNLLRTVSEQVYQTMDSQPISGVKN